MKKAFTLFLFLGIIVPCLNAQLKQIAEGPAFEEPENGYARILQMKDGSTMFFHFTEKKGINLRLYTPAHKEKTQTILEPSFGKIFEGGVKAIFELNGDAILLVGAIENRTPVLYRMIIDGKTGVLKEEKKILELTKLSAALASMAADASPGFPTFYACKNPNSNNYAVAMYTAEPDNNKRIQLVLFDGNHKEISKSFCLLPDNKFEYLLFVDMTMITPEKVALLAYGYNPYKSKSEASGLLLGVVDKNSPSITFTELAFSQNLDAKLGLIRFNPISKKLVVLSITQEKKSRSNEYQPYLALVNAETKSEEKAISLHLADDVLEKSVETFGNKAAFSGLPQNLYYQ